MLDGHELLRPTLLVHIVVQLVLDHKLPRQAPGLRQPKDDTLRQNTASSASTFADEPCRGVQPRAVQALFFVRIAVKEVLLVCIVVKVVLDRKLSIEMLPMNVIIKPAIYHELPQAQSPLMQTNRDAVLDQQLKQALLLPILPDTELQ